MLTVVKDKLQTGFHVLVIEDLRDKREIYLEHPTYSIGRESSNSIVLLSRLVSRHHATLLRLTDPETNEYVYWIIDGDLQGNHSSNGLSVNGKYCLSHQLKDGDEIAFAVGVKATYHIREDSVRNPDIDSNSIHPNGLSRRSQDLPTLEWVETFSEEVLVRLASFPELSPHPIIEINLEGKLTYYNPAAIHKFPDLQEIKISHPILAILLPIFQTKNQKIFVREVEIEDKIFAQYVHYIAESKLVRSYVFDITVRKQTEAALCKSEATNRALLNAIPDMMFRLSKEGIIVDFKVAKDFAPWRSPGKLLGRNICDTLPLEVAKLTGHYLKKALQTGEIQIFEYQLEKDEDVCYYEARYIVIGDGEVLGIVRDITERKQAERTIEYQAFHDLLTGLPNRALFDKRLSAALENARQHQNKLAVLFLDLDRFKIINDTLGHAVGDRLLQAFAQRLTNCLTNGDTISRWGGDEFTVLLPHINCAEDAASVARRILEALKPAFSLGDRQLYITASIGIAFSPQDGEDSGTLLRNADAALYRAKEQGRNHYQFYVPTMNSPVLLQLEYHLHHALERGEFLVYYQPQVNVKTGLVSGMEALVRWQHPDLGLIPPGQFIPLAEETGLIVPIGEWVLRTACAQNKAWQAAGLPPLKIAVNLSARQFQQPNLVEMVAQILDETGLNPNFLELEITETSIMQNVHLARQTLRDLKEMGVHISMDDFGTGYSSLGYLKQFPFHTLKIDRSFVRDLKEDSQDLGIISAVVALGHYLNLKVVAEGVETDGQLELLRNLQCEEIQGYLFSRPLPPAEATQFCWQMNGTHSEGRC